MHLSWVPVLLVLCLVNQGPAQTTTSAPYPYPSSCAPPDIVQMANYLRDNGTLMPDLPTIPSQFQVRVEANMLDRQATMVATEYYDMENHRSAIHSITNNTKHYMIFDYDHDQVIYDNNGICYAKDIQSDANNLMFGMVTSYQRGVPHVYSTQQALHFARANGLTYMGRQVIRGIICDWWQSCMYWQGLHANFTLDYFFSARDHQWTEPDNSMSVPVRAEIQGVVHRAGIDPRSFHHMYEYFDFRNKLWADDTVFQTPPGITCRFREQTKPIPTLPRQFSYKAELISTRAAAIDSADVYYDVAYQVARFDFRPPKKFIPPYNTRNPIMEIHDYHTGIAYVIDKILGNCSTIPIQNTSFDAQVNMNVTRHSQKDFYISMKTSSQLFHIDNTSYTYEGQRTVRGIPCDVFIATRHDFTLPKYKPFASTFEFYFMSDLWLNGNLGKSNKAKHVPVRLVIRTPQRIGLTITYNIFDFDAGDPSFTNFDVTPCYKADKMKPFVLKFPGEKWNSSMAEYKPQFIENTVNQLKKIGHLSHLRLQKIMLNYDNSQLLLTGLLLDKPMDLMYFKKVAGRFSIMEGGIETIEVSTTDGCASACNEPRDSPCNSFDICSADRTCRLYTQHKEDLTLKSEDGHCDNYIRTVGVGGNDYSMAKAWQEIQNEVLIGHFQITVVKTDGSFTPYTATSLEDISQRNQLTSSAVLDSMFSLQRGRSMTGHQDAQLRGASIGSCSTLCLHQIGWSCGAFTFCEATSYCVLSRIHPDADPSAVQKNSSCDVFARKYTSDYEKFPGLAVEPNSPAVIQNIGTADGCASKCSNYNNFTCKSFDFCWYSSTCYLGKSHYYDIPKTDKLDYPNCDHYSRQYLNDFKMIAEKQETSLTHMTINNVSLTQCAKMCVDVMAGDCSGFAYCVFSVECHLTNASAGSNDKTTLVGSYNCNAYTRQSFPDGTPYVLPAQRQVDSSNNNGAGGYSGGAMAGLGLTMLVLGLVIAGAAYKGFKKYREQA